MIQRPQEARAIGQRVRMIRRRRGLGLEVAAGLAGISKPYLSMLERGGRGFNRRGLLDDLARVLGCSVTDLTGQPTVILDQASAAALAVLTEIGTTLGDATLDDAPDVPTRPVEDLARLVEQANAHCDQTRYGLAGRGLGTILTELHVHVVTASTETRQAALAVLVEACLVAFAIAHGLDDPTIAVLAALGRRGERDRAAQLTSAGIEALAGLTDPTSADPATAEAYGMLHLRAALNSALSGRAAGARDHLVEAVYIAARTGERNTLRRHFGPTNTAVWSVAIGAELHDGPAADERVMAQPININALGSADRAAYLHFDCARLLAQAGGSRDTDAIRHLDTADRIAPVFPA
ncbi:MAG: helix-turn-helix domain-containing protein [Actinomycetota bacterium]|nr:helix-turn-helix domain-containing protein [Actinomycetota bacterium]